MKQSFIDVKKMGAHPIFPHCKFDWFLHVMIIHIGRFSYTKFRSHSICESDLKQKCYDCVSHSG